MLCTGGADCSHYLSAQQTEAVFTTMSFFIPHLQTDTFNLLQPGYLLKPFHRETFPALFPDLGFPDLSGKELSAPL